MYIHIHACVYILIYRIYYVQNSLHFILSLWCDGLMGCHVQRGLPVAAQAVARGTCWRNRFWPGPSSTWKVQISIDGTDAEISVCDVRRVHNVFMLNAYDYGVYDILTCCDSESWCSFRSGRAGLPTQALQHVTTWSKYLSFGATNGR